MSESKRDLDVEVMNRVELKDEVMRLRLRRAESAASESAWVRKWARKMWELTERAEAAEAALAASERGRSALAEQLNAYAEPAKELPDGEESK